MYHGCHFFALFFAISIDLGWGGNRALLLRTNIKNYNIPLQKTYVSGGRHKFSIKEYF